MEKSEWLFFFLGGGGGDHLASRFIYIYILCAVYLYKKNRYMSCMLYAYDFECLPLDATPRMRDVLFPC